VTYDLKFKTTTTIEKLADDTLSVEARDHYRNPPANLADQIVSYEFKAIQPGPRLLA
jgi:hypothetical protein